MTTAEQARNVDYVLVGGGLASATAAEEIRKQDAKGSIVIVTNDAAFPYHRPPLSKEYLRAEIGPDGTYGEGGVYVQLPNWYLEHQVEVLTNVEARALDTRARTVQLSNGQTIHFGTLLIATGGRPRTLSIPGADLAGVHLLRSLADADAIRAQVSEGKRVAVIGSGFIGMEVAASLLSKGAKVTIIEPQDRIWPGQVSPELSAFFRQQFEHHGAELRYGYLPLEFLGDNGRVGGVRVAPVDDKSKTEELPFDFIVVGVGIQLNTEFAASAGLAVDQRHGVVVNEQLETQVAGIFAAGDVAAYPDPIAGLMHFEHWDNAIASGQTAGKNMVDGDEPYRHVPYFFSDQFDLAINMLGYPSSKAEIVIRGELAKRAFTALYIQDGVLRAALMVNDDAQMDLIKELIAASAPAPQNVQQLADISFDLASLQHE